VNLLGQSITRNGLLLAGFAVLTVGVIASTNLGTRDQIAQAQRQAEERALLEIVPRSRHDNVMLDDTLPAPTGGDLLQLKEAKQIYLAKQAESTVTAIIPARAPDGYSGAIDLIVGVNRDGSVAGVRIVNHRETPGLGDKIDRKKSDWVESFRGRSLSDPKPAAWTVKKDGGAFDQFTGATVTPRAVVAATRRTLEYAKQHRAQLFGDENRTEDNS
jgi:electron transport complex protein RnfG